MAEGLSAREVEELARLLRKLSDCGMGSPHLPLPVFVALKGVVAQPTVELLLSRGEGEVLLTFREDEHWRGWHIPGGFVGCGESLQEACSRIARQELGIEVRMECIVSHATWDDHPYASALSLLCKCEFSEEPSTGRFFARLPESMISHHRELLGGVGWLS